KYQVPFYVKHFDTELYAGEQKISIQVAARNLRYNWFRALAKEIQAASHAPGSKTYILTAHHADDNIETVLMNFFKGTGIKGLTGIQPKQGILIRPLLFASKKQILDFAQTAGIAFREDSSNAKDNYTRNYFRNQLIPDIEK